MTDWGIINNRIKECQKRRVPEKVIECLLDLFQQTNDGWVAFNLAQEYENMIELERALEYYQKAETLLPLRPYKEKAREAISRVTNNLEKRGTTETAKEELIEGLRDVLKLDPANTLFIISCTPDKIWKNDPTAPDFVPAKYAYKKNKFLKFLR